MNGTEQFTKTKQMQPVYLLPTGGVRTTHACDPTSCIDMQKAYETKKDSAARDFLAGGSRIEQI